MRPCSSSTRSRRAITSVGSRTSATTSVAAPPSRRMSSTAARPRASSISATTTGAPWSAKSAAAAAPMPAPPPVITATRSDSNGPIPTAERLLIADLLERGQSGCSHGPADDAPDERCGRWRVWGAKIAPHTRLVARGASRAGTCSRYRRSIVVQAPDVVDAPGGVGVRPRRAFLAVAALCALLLVLVYQFAVETRWGQRLDATASRGRGQLHHRGIHAAARLLTTIDVASLVLLGGAVVLVAFLRTRPRLAVGAGAVIAGSVLTSELLKRVVLSRPDLGIYDGLNRAGSFPSGHTTVALSLGVGAMMVSPSRWRPYVGALGAAFGSTIGVPTVAA